MGTSSPPRASAKVCRRCGCRLSRDHLDDEWCSPCLRSRRDYDPSGDPFFSFKVLAVLAEKSPERVDPIRALGVHPEHRIAVKGAVRTLRRRGFVITGAPRSTGYHYLGYVECRHRDSEALRA